MSASETNELLNDRALSVYPNTSDFDLLSLTVLTLRNRMRERI